MAGRKLDSGPDQNDEPADVGHERKERIAPAFADRLEQDDPHAEERDESHPRVLDSAPPTDDVHGEHEDNEESDEYEDQAHLETPL